MSCHVSFSHVPAWEYRYCSQQRRQQRLATPAEAYHFYKRRSPSGRIIGGVGYFLDHGLQQQRVGKQMKCEFLLDTLFWVWN